MPDVMALFGFSMVLLIPNLQPKFKCKNAKGLFDSFGGSIMSNKTAQKKSVNQIKSLCEIRMGACGNHLRYWQPELKQWRKPVVYSATNHWAEARDPIRRHFDTFLTSALVI